MKASVNGKGMGEVSWAIVTCDLRTMFLFRFVEAQGGVGRGRGGEPIELTSGSHNDEHKLPWCVRSHSALFDSNEGLQLPSIRPADSFIRSIHLPFRLPLGSNNV